MATPEASRRIVIVGGGFAGADLARALPRRLPSGWEVVLFTRENHFVFTPLLAEVVGAAIDPLHVVWPVREMAREVACRTSPVLELDVEGNEVVCEGPDGERLRTRYDHLVIACGLDVNLGMIPGMADHGWALKTLGDAIALRNHIVQQLERAEAEPDPERRAEFLSFAVVGGGFTGVEIAGSIMDLLLASCRFYRRFSREDLRVSIVDGGDRLLGPMPEALSAYARRELERQGVQVCTQAKVQAVRADGIQLGDGTLVGAATTISAVGNAVQPLLAETTLPIERGRLTVEGTMRVRGHENVWALGDCAAVPNAHDGSISPTLGQFAARQASLLARNLVAVIGGGEPSPFHYRPEGMFAAIGHSKAVGNPFGVQVSGLLAYLMWRGIYWTKMPTLARKLQIAFDWFWDFFFPRDIVEISTLRTPARPPSTSNHPGDRS
jgi:NADH dehydrogenase